jgi:hypothetical protein
MTIMSIVALILSPAVRSLLLTVLSLLPEYWYSVPASSSGKYHPAFSLGYMGLIRHSIVTAVFANRIATAWGWDQHKIDLITAAALIHDGLKQGWIGRHTVHEHPVLMANYVAWIFQQKLDDPDIQFIINVIASHMGKWNTSKYSDVVLPVPMDEFQKCLSAADMCAAEKRLGFDFTSNVELKWENFVSEEQYDSQMDFADDYSAWREDHKFVIEFFVDDNGCNVVESVAVENLETMYHLEALLLDSGVEYWEAV